MNRKLIRTTLAEVKGRETTPASAATPEPQPQPRERERTSAPPPARSAAPHRSNDRPSPPPRDRESSGASAAALAAGRKKIPPQETNAEIFYYKKQMDSHTPMVIVLLDGEEVEGTIEWYDRNALKINRRDAPNIMLLKHNIKYMFKAEDRDASGEEEEDDDE
ncbi:MAG TPA: hypothetical protein VGX48_06930 [Pyrinomonadaceae bacterium]|nr:hypothetical protein [Pyrinomonadaceae bacterium]